MDRGTWQAMVHMVAKSRTQLKRLGTRACMVVYVCVCVCVCVCVQIYINTYIYKVFFTDLPHAVNASIS